MMIERKAIFRLVGGAAATALAAVLLCSSQVAQAVVAREAVVDPGVRGGPPGVGGPLSGLTPDELQFFNDGLKRFADVEVVTGGANNGLGPRFNSNSCLSCHSQPAPGGSSPAMNPTIAVATLNGAMNVIPWFVAQNGPVREARFKKIAMAAAMARCTLCSLSRAAATLRVATSRSRISFRPATR